MKKPCLLYFFFVFLFGCCYHKVMWFTRIGDSITEGYGIAVQSKIAYLVILNNILGVKYSVLNCERSVAAIQKKAISYIGSVKNFRMFLRINQILLSSN